MFVSYFSTCDKTMEDPTLAYEDMLFFEHRLTEVISGMQPRVRKWKTLLMFLLISTACSAYYWILDPSLKYISFFESLALHPFFTASISLLLILFIVFGVHKRVVAPRIIANRCSNVLSDFCLSCDEQGKLIVRPAYSPAVSPVISNISKKTTSRISMCSPSSPISNLTEETDNNLDISDNFTKEIFKKEKDNNDKMSYLYKIYRKILLDWPIDKLKSNERNFRFHLEQQLESAFQPSSINGKISEDEERTLNKNVNIFKCKERLEALQRLSSNVHLNQFPLNYTAGANGYRKEKIQKFNSDIERKNMGMYSFTPGYKQKFILFLKKIFRIEEEGLNK